MGWSETESSSQRRCKWRSLHASMTKTDIQKIFAENNDMTEDDNIQTTNDPDGQCLPPPFKFNLLNALEATKKRRKQDHRKKALAKCGASSFVETDDESCDCKSNTSNESAPQHRTNASCVPVTPRLVRSRSIPNHSSSATAHRNAARLVRSRSFHGIFPTLLCCNTPKTNNVLPAVQCLKTLLKGLTQKKQGGQVKLSKVGPTPRASLLVVSSKRRAVVIVIWGMGCQVRVIPLLGCGESIQKSWDVASVVEARLRDRLRDIVEMEKCITFTSYWDWSNNIVSHEEDWVALLEETIPLPTQNDKTDRNRRLLRDGCAKAGLSVGICNDRFGLFKLWVDKKMNGDDDIDEMNDKDNTENEEEDDEAPPKICLVCFDEISSSRCNEVNQLTPCGHYTCSGCWRAYLASAASSGQGGVVCSAHKCNSRVDLLDSAHILFLNGEDEDNENIAAREVFDRLVHFEMENDLSSLFREGGSECQKCSRFCPTPGCGRVLASSGMKSAGAGCSLMLCNGCGWNCCAECKNGGPSHPGMACTQFQKMHSRISSGKFDAELANVRWVMQNSRPCPKCNYPIEKNGGCNHVHCQRCHHYFCWQCLGPGNECGSFYCRNTQKSSDQQPDDDAEQHRGMSNLVESYRDYRWVEKRLKALKKGPLSTKNVGDHHTDKETKLCVLESQLLQVLLWVHASNISKAMANPTQSTKDQTVHLELKLVLHAISMRKLFLSQVEGPKVGETVVHGLSTKEPSKWKRQRGGHTVAPGGRNRNNSSSEEKNFSQLCVDQELADLLQMPEDGFYFKSRGVIHRCIKTLKPASQPNKRLRRKRKKVSEEQHALLNEKMKRPNDPWRNGYKVVYVKEEEEDEVVRWKKNKARLSQRRAHAMNRRQFYEKGVVDVF